MSHPHGTPLTLKQCKLIRAAAHTFKRNIENEMLRLPTRRKTNRTPDYEDNLNALHTTNEALLAALRDELPVPLDAELLAHAAFVIEEWMSDKTDTQSKNLTNRYSARQLHNEYSAVHNAITDLQGVPPLFKRAPYPIR
mgnify:CR=1 FL=1